MAEFGSITVNMAICLERYVGYLNEFLKLIHGLVTVAWSFFFLQLLCKYLRLSVRGRYVTRQYILIYNNGYVQILFIVSQVIRGTKYNCNSNLKIYLQKHQVDICFDNILFQLYLFFREFFKWKYFVVFRYVILKLLAVSTITSNMHCIYIEYFYSDFNGMLYHLN